METLSDIEKAVKRLKKWVQYGLESDNPLNVSISFDPFKYKDFFEASKTEGGWPVRSLFGYLCEELEKISAWLTDLNEKNLMNNERLLIDEVVEVMEGVRVITDHPQMKSDQRGVRLVELYQQAARKLDLYSSKGTASTSTADNDMIIDDRIINVLPELYDILINFGVIDGSVTKQNFFFQVMDGEIQYKEGSRTKFKGFVHCIKPYFSDKWYNSICTRMDEPHKKMQKYNTDRTADLEKALKKCLPILERN